MAAGRRFRGGWLPAAACLALSLALVGCARETRRPNIVVLVLDTLRRDAAGLPDASTPDPLRVADLTPRLAALSREGVTFAGACAAAPWTVPSHQASPPPPRTAELPVIVLFCMAPAQLSSPPPLPAELPVMTLAWIVSLHQCRPPPL